MLQIALVFIVATVPFIVLLYMGARSLINRLRSELSRCTTDLVSWRAQYHEIQAAHATLIEDTYIRRKPSKEVYREISDLYDEPDMIAYDLPMERVTQENGAAYCWRTLSAADVIVLYDNGFYARK